ncbi:heavy-metal-associated domain-containing protein [Aliifodinibius sp. S!AR15-10]|uniref:heavy-metal-associated domain-containing protein n=1 Tax=Aliifodinibius sp. S!AR15-10 TaxID=2950437 RepID=UPI0028586252|nr:heavy-metal-associated domain-containing protein [Aliifodinibius sp. S!AR15-10]MDR8390488.1 heavy-metal-associated domain-containing protein [Aliifodinibius sp. S!AR15-10]
MEKLTFNIPDLHCEGCADRTTNILERLDGVNNTNVAFDDKSAEVEFDPEQASFEDFKNALAKANYTAERKSTAKTEK